MRGVDFRKSTRVRSDMTDTKVQPDPKAAELLILRLRTGHSDAPLMLNQMYRDALLRFCWGYLGNLEEAEDALQEISYKVITAAEIPDHFRPWLYRVARNHCLNLLRERQNRRDDGAMPPASLLGESLTGHLTRLVRDEMKAKVNELVLRLPDSMREVLRLRYVEDLSRAEIANVLEISESAVKTRLFEGLRKLKDLAGEGGDSEVHG